MVTQDRSRMGKVRDRRHNSWWSKLGRLTTTDTRAALSLQPIASMIALSVALGRIAFEVFSKLGW